MSVVATTMAAPLVDLFFGETFDDGQACPARWADGAESSGVSICSLWRAAFAQPKASIVGICLVELTSLAESLWGVVVHVVLPVEGGSSCRVGAAHGSRRTHG